MILARQEKYSWGKSIVSAPENSFLKTPEKDFRYKKIA